MLGISARPSSMDSKYLQYFTSFNIPSILQESPAEENVRISYCLLENACIMLLSPRERVVRSLTDTWTRLWEHTTTRHHHRFSLTDVVEKLMVSLDTYKVSWCSQCSVQQVTVLGVICEMFVITICGKKRGFYALQFLIDIVFWRLEKLVVSN